MTHPRDMDELLREWADEGDERMPSHNLEAALATIETTPQRGARPALLEGIIMRLRPYAIPAALIATLVIAVATFAFVSRPPSVGPESSPSPTATQISGDFQTSAFGVPLTIDLSGGVDPTGWFVRETASALIISATGVDGDRLLILDGADTSVVSAGGQSEPLGDDLAATLQAVAGVSAEPLQAFDREGQMTVPISGEDVPVTAVTVDGSASGRTLFGTTDGAQFGTTADAPWWLLRLQQQGHDLVLIVPSPESADSGFSGSYLAMLESIVLR